MQFFFCLIHLIESILNLFSESTHQSLIDDVTNAGEMLVPAFGVVVDGAMANGADIDAGTLLCCTVLPLGLDGGAQEESA